jgi:hypothetical protein
MKTKLHVNLGLMGLVFSLFFTAAVAAQDHVVVAPGNTQGWSDSSSTAGGSVDFVTDEDAPRGVGALELSTDSTTTAKANYMLLMEPVAFADLTDLSYYNKTVSASFAQGAASYQLTVCLEGYDADTESCTGFTTLVFEPYWNTAQGPVVFGEWQEWDVDEGLFWSTRTYTGAGTCSVVAGAGGPPVYTLDALTASCPDAEVVAIAVNVGSNNPDYVTRVDLVQFNDTIYDFEPYIVPTEMGQCKGMGWRHVRMPDGTPFRNQGLCVAYVVTNHPPGERRGQQ